MDKHTTDNKGIEILHSPYQPRPLQAQLHKQLKRFNVIVAHRRFGKTYFCLNQMGYKALQCTNPRPQYAYIAPEKAQAKKIVWPIIKENLSFLPGIKFNESELKVEFTTLSGTIATIFVEGADDPDRLRGMYLDGVVLDEVAQMPNDLWSKVLLPTLTDREGWAIFIGTPAGKNKFYELYQRSLSDDAKLWAGFMFKASETGIFSDAQLSEFAMEQGEEAFEQEFECSFDASVKGTYYGKHLNALREAGYIGSYPWNPKYPVFTGWDIGSNDKTAIWFAQIQDGTIRLIDYFETPDTVGKDVIFDIPYYINMVLAKPYKYKHHYFPHDVKQTHFGMSQTRLEQLRSGLGHNIRVITRTNINDGIAAVRSLLTKCTINTPPCQKGYDAIFLYRSIYNERLGVFNQQPKHDWTSHAADALRYLALGIKDTPNDLIMNDHINKKYVIYDDYDPFL